MKAIVGAAIAGLGALGSILVGDASFGDVTDGQWVFVALTLLTAFSAIWATPNTTK
jgi:hypothetical protein